VFAGYAYDSRDHQWVAEDAALRKVWKAPLGRKRHQRKHLDFTLKIC